MDKEKRPEIAPRASLGEGGKHLSVAPQGQPEQRKGQQADDQHGKLDDRGQDLNPDDQSAQPEQREADDAEGQEREKHGDPFDFGGVKKKAPAAFLPGGFGNTGC